MDIHGLKKDQFLLKVFFKNKAVRKLPFGFQMYLRKILKYEKFVKVGDKTVILSQMPPYPGRAFDRYFEGLLATSKGKHVPLSLEFAVTNKCRFKCWHCSNVHRKGKELSTDQVTSVIDEFMDIGVTWVGLTGGEPLLRKDIVEIVRSIDDRASSALFTTGDRLTEKKARAFKDAGLFSIVVSLDSVSPGKHDKLRGIPGAYDIAMDAVVLSQKMNFYTVISTVATRKMIQDNELIELLKLGKKQRVHEVRILEIAQSGKLVDSFDDVLNSEDKKQLFKIHKNANSNKEFPRVMAFPYLESPEILGCPGGFHHLTVDANGNVTPCPFTPLSLGNVIYDGVKTVWERYKKHIKFPRCNCLNLDNIERIRSSFDKTLPLPYDESVKILDESASELDRKNEEDAIPTFYRKLGVKRR